jgi:beta-glucosidase
LNNLKKIYFIVFLSASLVMVYFLLSAKVPPLYRNGQFPTALRVDDLLRRMTVDEKIGQMALVEKNSIHDPEDLQRYGIGALLSGGGQNPVDNTVEGWRRMISDFQVYSRKSRLGIPLLYGVDANHGHGNLPGATVFPHFIGLGAGGDADLVRRVARATAEEVAATGVYWIFSPNLDVVGDTRWGRTYETFGSDPELVGMLGQAYVEGLQSVNQGGHSMAATAKHYVGSGAAEWGSSIKKNDYMIDQGNSNVSEEELRKTHIEPFKRALAADVKTVMIGLNSWNGTKISSNSYLINDVLRGELGFDGVILSDWYGVYEQEEDPYGALVDSVNAGIDLVMLPYDYKTFAGYMKQALAKGDISPKRLDDAVGKILKLKFELGLFDHSPGGADDAGIDKIGSPEHREIAREAVRKSLVVLKNEQVLPVSKQVSRILVAGSAADNLGRQMGGWTVEWQGIDGNMVDGKRQPGTTILEGVKKVVSDGTEIIYDREGNFSRDVSAEVGMAVVGEKPYAEGVGDNVHPQLSGEDLKAIANLKKHSRKVVVIIISGRPLDIREYSGNWDAVVAAWLPGSEGEGIADVIFGDFPFTGKLPVEWRI